MSPGDAVGRGDEKQPVQPFGHRRVDESRLCREHVDPGGMQPVAQALQEQPEPPLGGAVHVVRLAPPVSGDRGDGDDPAASPGLEVVGEVTESQGGGREVGLQGAHHLPGVAAHPFLVSHVAEHEEDEVEIPGRFPHPLGESGKLGELKRVELEQGRLAVQGELEVAGQGLELLDAPGGQHEAPPFIGQAPGEGLGDPGARAEHESPFHVSPSRSDCSERSRPCGSYCCLTRRNSSSRGYMRRNCSGSRTASLAR